MKLHKALPNWDQIRSERRKRQRQQQEDESNQRKKARIQEPVTVLEDDSDDEDEDMERHVVETNMKDLSELEKSIFGQLSNIENVVELLIASMVNTKHVLMKGQMI